MENEKHNPITIGYLYDSDNCQSISIDVISKLDYVNYSFALIDNGRAYIKEKNNLDKILKYKDIGVKISLSIGGWGADGFSEAVSSKNSRKIFIDSIIDLIKKYDFDGSDLDWEYPSVSFANISSSKDDISNFVFLCKELKERFLEFDKKIILSAAVPCSDKYYDYKELNKLLDYVNIMSYDLSVSSDIAKHHCNLYANKEIHSYSSADEAVKQIMRYVPKEKIVIGIAFYGRYGEFKGKDFKLGDKLDRPQLSSFSYKDIKEMISNGVEVLWDDIAKAPYIISDGKFISFDNQESIKEKSQYVIKNGLGGLMFWQLGASSTNELVETIYRFTKMNKT